MFGSRIGGYDYSNIRFAVAHVTSLWKPVKFGRCLQTSPGTTFTLAFYNGLTNREAAFKRLNGNNLATSCANLVNFYQMISEFTLLKCSIFAAIQSQFDDSLYLSRWCSETD